MGNGPNIGGGLGFDSIKEAFKQALQEAGGGGGLTFPDSLVTGVGAYTIPVGFNAIVNVTCMDGAILTVNGNNAVISKDLTISRIYNNCGASAHVTLTTTIGSNKFGEIQAHSHSPSAIQTMLFDSINMKFQNSGDGINDDRSWCGKIGPGGNISQYTSFYSGHSGYQKGSESQLAQARFTVLEGTVLNGGSTRLIELYAM